MNINDISFGNPDRSHSAFLINQSYLEESFSKFTEMPFPEKKSKETVDELNEIQEHVEQLFRDTNSLPAFQAYDRSLDKVLVLYLTQNGFDPQKANDLIEKLIADVYPLVYKLKYYFQRPRPYQLAYYMQLQLFPFQSVSSNSPSYPSLHATMSQLFAGVVENLNPKLIKSVRDFADHVSLSRVYMGACYKSDLLFGQHIASVILQNKQFKLKYNL